MEAFRPFVSSCACVHRWIVCFFACRSKDVAFGGSSKPDGLLLRPGSLPLRPGGLPLGPSCQSRQREAGRPRYVAGRPCCWPASLYLGRAASRTTPLRRARRDNQNGVLIHSIRSPDTKVMAFTRLTCFSAHPW